MQLIEHYMRTTPCMAVAECHIIAGLISRVCAVRLGSLDTPRAQRATEEMESKVHVSSGEM